MLPNSQRIGSLGSITLVDNIVRLSTTAAFDLVLPTLAEVDKFLQCLCVHSDAIIKSFGLTAVLFLRSLPASIWRMVLQVVFRRQASRHPLCGSNGPYFLVSLPDAHPAPSVGQFFRVHLKSSNTEHSNDEMVHRFNDLRAEE